MKGGLWRLGIMPPRAPTAHGHTHAHTHTFQIDAILRQTGFCDDGGKHGAQKWHFRTGTVNFFSSYFLFFCKGRV